MKKKDENSTGYGTFNLFSFSEAKRDLFITRRQISFRVALSLLQKKKKTGNWYYDTLERNMVLSFDSSIDRSIERKSKNNFTTMFDSKNVWFKIRKNKVGKTKVLIF